MNMCVYARVKADITGSKVVNVDRVVGLTFVFIFFQLHGVGLKPARGDMVEAKVAT